MTKKQIILWLIQIVLVVFLGALQFVDKDSGGQQEGFAKFFATSIFNHRLLLSIGLGIIFALLSGWRGLLYPRKQAKEIRQRIMDTMLDELCDGDQNNYRITIFKDANIFRRTKIYWRQSKECYKHWRQNKKLIYPKKGKYVFVWERLGTEHPNSKTCFYYSAETARKCQGVAGAVRQGLSDIVVESLPNIENVDLSSIDLKNKRSSATKAVRDYMARGYVNDFDTLKRINRRARHIYGNILNNLDGKPKGVLVIDSFLETSFLSEEVIGKLTHYASIIGATM